MNDQEQTTVETKTEDQSAPAQETKKMSQKDAVYNFVVEVVNGSVEYGQVLTKEKKLKELVTKEVRKAVRQKLFTAVKSSQIRMSKDMDESKLKKYCSGLINNWLNKDERFN